MTLRESFKRVLASNFQRHKADIEEGMCDVAVGAPLTGLSVAAGTAVALRDKLEGLDQPAAEAARLTGYGHLFAGRIIAGAITRAWWPLVLPLALVSKRARRILAALEADLEAA